MSKNEPREKKRRGGQPGNRNAVKHGLYSKAAREEKEEVAELTKVLRELSARS
mgnify:CR=1 FL=1